MTLEALRMHAAEHNGELPLSLEDLSPVPALPDPYTGKAFVYQVEDLGGVKTVSLATGSSDFRDEDQRTIRVRFAKSLQEGSD